jgi:hypothetical protein
MKRPFTPPTFTLFRALLPFAFNREHGYVARAECPFQPVGALIWGAPPGAHVEFSVGARFVHVVGLGHVPARFFSTGDSFAKVAELIAEGKDPPAWCTWPTLEAGMYVRAQIRPVTSWQTPNIDGSDLLGPDDGIEIMVWGMAKRSLTEAPPPMVAGTIPRCARCGKAAACLRVNGETLVCAEGCSPRGAR